MKWLSKWQLRLIESLGLKANTCWVDFAQLDITSEGKPLGKRKAS